jgi:hypothetical protein
MYVHNVCVCVCTYLHMSVRDDGESRNEKLSEILSSTVHVHHVYSASGS